MLTLLGALGFLVAFGAECLIYWHRLAGGAKPTLDYGLLHAAGLTFVASFFWVALWLLQEIPFQRACARARRSVAEDLLSTDDDQPAADSPPTASNGGSSE